jgi:hypothetical protein
MATSPSIQPLLCKPYERHVWQKLLHSLFPDGSLHLFSSPQKLAASQEKVKSTRQLGTIALPDGNTIALLEVETTDQIKLARNRVGLRNFVSTFIDEAGASAVLAVFHQEKSEDWRLTYAARQTTLDEETSAIVTIETAPRRFTFVLGRNEPCRTAAARLATLLEKGDELSLTDVEKAFSVETLSKDFFKKYKEHYQAFVTFLQSPTRRTATRKTFGVPSLADEAEQDKADKPIRDFVKTLLGRLVFLHFLQKKGWLGCKAGSRAWTGGAPDFVQSLFSMAKSRKDAGHFHSKYLSALFFEALNMADRPGDIFPLTNSRLPYLNGGLFEEESAALRALDFPAELFTNLLDFFGEYNFTIDENDPEDHEVGIDPEMLGHIFENLLEDNKDKGTFYTPKAIVSYMSRQSLLHYLQTHLGENKELEILLNEKDPTKHQGKDSFVAKHREKIIKLLEDVKICDPAIGSGAFPIGLLQEILWTRLALQPELNTSVERAKLKRQIIQHSIHGVDIDPGAIEIARLRFWLALVVDEDEPRPLPNLDYKIHRADSLIEYIRGESVNLGTETPKDAAAKAAVEKLIAAKQSLFTAQGMKEKRSAWFDLYRALAQLAQAEFTWMRNGTNFADGERLSQLTRGIKEFGQWIGQIDAIKKEKAQLQDSLLAKLKHWFDDPAKPTFLWNLHFGEIMANGRFDIMIGNPPYGVPFSASYKAMLAQAHAGIPDYEAAYFFISLGLGLIKDEGFLAFIVPNTWLSNFHAKKFRQRMISEFDLIECIDCSSVKVFESATVRNSIPFLTRRSENALPKEIDFRSLDALGRTLPARKTSVDELKENLANWMTLFSISGDENLIVTKLRTSGFPLKDFSEVSQGLIPYDKYRGHSPETVKNRIWHAKSKLDASYKRELKGGDVSRYRVTWNGKMWISYGPWLAAPRDPKFFKNPRILVREITNPRILACFETEEFYNTPSIINVTNFCGVDPHFMLAVICSNPISFFHIQCSPKSKKGLFPKILVNDVRNLPIPTASESDQMRLADLARACMDAAKKNNLASLSVLESEINTIVYRLFDLTPEEIALIESSLST